MSPDPFDIDTLRAQYPDIPGWGVRLFVEIHDLRVEVRNKMGELKGWTAQDIVIVCTAIAGVIGALKAGGAV